MTHEIRITAPPQLVRGRPLRVPLVVSLVQPLKVRGIHARFHAAEETKADYTTTSTDSKGNTQTHHHTAVQRDDIVARDWLLAGNEKLGCLGNLWDAAATLFGGGQHERLAPGEYPYEVELQIPEDAPGTHMGKKSRIFYELSVQVDVPLGGDLKALHSFDVEPLPKSLSPPAPFRICYPDDVGRGFFDKAFGPDVRIDLALDSDQYAIGEEVVGMFRIDTPKPLKCRAIRVCLVGLERSQAEGHHDSYTHRSEPLTIAEPGVITDFHQQEFTFVVPTLAPVSNQGKRFTIEWSIQVWLDVPWAKDPLVRAPITLLGV